MSNNIEFPTGKGHISFSEIKCWKECTWRHKLMHIDKIDIGDTSPYLYFGTCAHAGIENFLETGSTDAERLLDNFRSDWNKNGFSDPEWISRQPGWYKSKPVDEWCQWAQNMWNDIPSFLDETFPGWKIHKAEEMLYESIHDKNLNFKGFIDAVFEVPDKKGDIKYWIIDWKTAPKYGWRRDKKQDILMTSQLILYKYFWALKYNIPLKDIRCGFVLLKREAKPGKICELVTVSVGPKSLSRALKILNNMISSVRKSMFLKNRNSCRFCQFKDTEYCT